MGGGAVAVGYRTGHLSTPLKALGGGLLLLRVSPVRSLCSEPKFEGPELIRRPRERDDEWRRERAWRDIAPLPSPASRSRLVQSRKLPDLRQLENHKC